MNFNSKKETADKKERQGADDATKLQDEQVNAAEENATSDNVTDEGPEQKELEELKKKYDELNDSHLRLMAEFDNYRKRTLREKSELIKNGGESALTHLLPVVGTFVLVGGGRTAPQELFWHLHKLENLLAGIEYLQGGFCAIFFKLIGTVLIFPFLFA